MNGLLEKLISIHLLQKASADEAKVDGQESFSFNAISSHREC